MGVCKSKPQNEMITTHAYYDNDHNVGSHSSYQAMDSESNCSIKPTQRTSPASSTSTTSSTFYDIYGQSNIMMPSSSEQTPESYYSRQSITKYQKKYYKYSPTRCNLPQRSMSEPIPIPPPRSPFRSYKSGISPYVLHNPKYE